jgi:hypothetical protein
MTSHKKPGVAFWASVVVVAVLAYPLSYGPWMAIREKIPDQVSRGIERLYRPLLPLFLDAPDSITVAYVRYLELWSDAPILKTIRSIRGLR